MPNRRHLPVVRNRSVNVSAPKPRPPSADELLDVYFASPLGSQSALDALQKIRSAPHWIGAAALTEGHDADF